MIERAHIVVEGLPGSGKTTFIRRLLESNRSLRIDVVRLVRTPGLDRAKESPEGNRETTAFLQAGAVNSVLVHYPERGAMELGDVVEEVALGLDSSHAVIYETEDDFDYPTDLTVLVTRPVLDGRMEPLYRARLVVINIHGDGERPHGEALRAIIQGRTGGRRLNVKVADLAGPMDAELKKALDAVKRRAKQPADYEHQHEYGEFEENEQVPVEALEIDIELCDIEPKIWRRIEIAEECTFWDLHFAIQNAMGWTNSHLHMFRADLPAGTLVVGVPDKNDFEEVFPGWDYPVAEVLIEPGDEVTYIYDFGDDWTHRITLRRVEESDPGLSYPRCVAGARACPPEDCGGTPGYDELVAAMRDPRHERHAELVEWLGGPFDPEEFDPKAIRFQDPGKQLGNIYYI